MAAYPYREDFVLYPAAILLAELVKVDIIILDSRVESYRNMHQAKGYSASVGYRHGNTSVVLQIVFPNH